MTPCPNDQKEREHDDYVHLQSALLLLMAACASALAAEEPAPQWLDSYSAGMQQAKQSGRQMLVYFHQDKLTPKQDKLVQKLSERHGHCARSWKRRPGARAAFGPGTCGRQGDPADRALVFAELQRQPGIAIIDFTDPKSEHYGHVVSIYPLSLPGALTTHSLSVVADVAARDR